MNNLFRCCVAFSLLTWPASIGKAEDAVATIMGRVTLNGKPIVEGKLLAKRPGDKKAIETPIKTGLYTATKVAPGEYVVAIEGKGVPAKYSSFEVSALKVSVKEGANTFDFDLAGD